MAELPMDESLSIATATMENVTLPISVRTQAEEYSPL